MLFEAMAGDISMLRFIYVNSTRNAHLRLSEPRTLSVEWKVYITEHLLDQKR